MKRDLNATQFRAQCAKLGFRPQGFLGYYDLGLPDQEVCVSALNAGPRRRNQIAYLIAKRKQKLASTTLALTKLRAAIQQEKHP